MLYFCYKKKGEGFMYNDFYDTNLITSTTTRVDSTWLVVSAVLAIIGGIVAYFLFISKKKGEFSGFLAWLHDFLNFKVYFIDMFLKTLYVVSTIYVTLGSFSLIGSSVAAFFLMLILGNVVLRVAYEFILMFLTLVNNTTEINSKLGSQKKESVKEVKPQKSEKSKIQEKDVD